MGADWPHYRGINRDGKTTERIESWPPAEIWRASIGEGYSAVTVSDGRVYAMGWHDDQDIVFCFDEESAGNNPAPLWTNYYPCGTVSFNGTRGTPTVHSNEVYTFSHEGRLTCFNKVDGTYLWHRFVTGSPGQWGFGCSVFVENGLDFTLGMVKFKYVKSLVFPQTKEVGKYQRLLQNVRCGGDERAYNAIVKAIDMVDFRPGARRRFIVVTDEKMKGSYPILEVIKRCQKSQIKLDVIGIDDRMDKYLARQTGGMWYLVPGG